MKCLARVLMTTCVLAVQACAAPQQTGADGAAVGSGGAQGGDGSDAGAPAGSGGAAGQASGSGGVTGSGGKGSGGAGSGGVTGTGGKLGSGGAGSGGVTGTGGKLGSGGAGSGGKLGSGGAGSGGVTGSGGVRATFRNPLNQQQGSDPWLTYYNGYYYLTATTWSSVLTVKKSRTIAGLKTAAESTVWTGDDASRCCNFWAPEMHLLSGPNGTRWYFYYTGGPSGTDTSNQRTHVLESAGTDPMGPYTYKGRIYDPKADFWAIDSSVVTINGSLYFLFSAWVGSNQSLFIAPMSNPWTLSGSRVLISQPTYDWEKVLANVNEGPVALQHGGKTFVVFSGSACWGPDYKLGMLTLTGTNPLSASSWTKSPNPVFQRNDAGSVYGPAHNGFFTSPNGAESWIVYHANSSVTGVCDTRRTTRVQPFTWNSDGTPNFGAPLPLSTDIPVPAGE